MAVAVPSSPDISLLPLRQAPEAIRDRPDFTIGGVTVNYAGLLAREGATYRGLALEEARGLGGLMLNIREHEWDPRNRRVASVEPAEGSRERANRVLTTVPILETPPHSWTFGTRAITSGTNRTDLLSVSFEGEGWDSGDEQESYYRSMQGIGSGPVSVDRLPGLRSGEPEDPNDLFYVAELGLLRAARVELAAGFRLHGDVPPAHVVE